MSLKKILFKPRWQHKDPAVRAQAVAHGGEPELLAALPDICLADESAQVRTAAIRRLHDLPCLVRALGQAGDAGERELLTERIRHLATSQAKDRPSLEDRLQAVRSTDDRALLAGVASAAPEAGLRRAAIERIEAPGVLGDAAIGDADADNRRLAAARIRQRSTLCRVIEATRTSDKALHQELNERLHREQLVAGEAEAVRREALSICQRLEALALAPGEQRGAGLEQLKAAWSSLPDTIDPELTRRQQAILARLQASTPIRDPHPNPAPEPEPEPEPTPRPAPDPRPDPNPDADTAAAASRTSASASRDAEAARQAALAADIDARIAKLEARTEAGELHEALLIRAAIFQAGKGLARGPARQTLQRRLAPLQAQLRELRDWLHWSNNKIRKRLIREVEALPASGLHPDAVLEKLKALQGEWKEMEKSEQIPGDRHFSAPPWMWRRFQAAGRQAFEGTKPFLDKRTEVRQAAVEQIEALLEALAAQTAAESPDWNQLRRGAGEAGRGLRELGTLPAAARKGLAGRLRKAMDAANARLREQDAEVEKTKRQLIRAAAQLAHVEDRAEAIAKAKSLQADWKAAGRLKRGLEQELWKAFRAPIDPLFEDLKARHEAEREQRAREQSAQESLLAELEELLQLEPEAMAEQAGRLQGIQDAWREIPANSAKLRSRFQQGLEQFEHRRREAQQLRAQARRERWWHKARLLHALESSLTGQNRKQTPPANAWPSAEVDDTETDRALDERWTAARALAEAGEGLPVAEAPTETARGLCIQLEFLAGLPSPGGEEEQRMRYQVERLSATLSGDSQRMPAVAEARQAEHEWLLLPLLPEPEYDAFEHRIRAALDEINKV